MEVFYTDLTKRSFIPGDEWIYYKLYSGPRTLESVLITKISDLVDSFLEEKIIDKFFFIRFIDMEYHIRIRFHLLDPAFVGEVIQRMNKLLYSYLNDRIISKVSIDTYNREIERYGFNTIELVETYFSNESLKMIYLLKNGGISENDRWIYMLYDINKTLTDFGLTLEEKFAFSEMGRESYNQEFNISKPTRLQIDKKYRTVENRIKEFSFFTLGEDICNNGIVENIEVIQKIIELKNNNLLYVEFKDLIFSLIHMKVNRFFRTNQRFVECVLYNFIYKYYKSELAKIKYLSIEIFN